VDSVSPSTPSGIAVWDIVRVDFPFADEAKTRRRPGLIVAVPAMPRDIAVLWVVMITSAPGGRWPLDVPISDLGLGGLDRPCVVRTSKITVLDARLAVRIGALADVDRVKVRVGLCAVLKDALAE
jgi:mRNA-degrading endonuclease toxin of MazEF toxin-antitoxin module